MAHLSKNRTHDPLSHFSVHYCLATIALIMLQALRASVGAQDWEVSTWSDVETLTAGLDELKSVLWLWVAMRE